MMYGLMLAAPKRLVYLTMTQDTQGDLLKVMSWYDNEWGYSVQMVREAVGTVKASYCASCNGTQ